MTGFLPCQLHCPPPGFTSVISYKFDNYISDSGLLSFQAFAKTDSSLTQELSLSREDIWLEFNTSLLTSDLNNNAFRYKKGLEILKMLYEKILALDHHFSSLRTFRDIQELTNPNAYPEFANAKLEFKKNTSKKSSIELPDLLDNNPFISIGYTLLSSVFGEGDKAQREEEIEKISCLLDFTISMHSDIKIIYYETDYLRTSNKELLSKCRLLFEEYTSVVRYNKSLDYCRINDDWDNLNLALDRQVENIQRQLNQEVTKELKITIHNLNFSIDRLVKFIENYDSFVYQGEQYYQKFRTIINSYEYKSSCFSRLPKSFAQLEQEIDLSISKFKTAYNMAELSGSKLRDLLYGDPEDI